MTTLYRVRTRLEGIPSGPGVSTMYFLDKATAVASVRKFWQAVMPYVPAAVVAQTENTGDTLESTNGLLNGAWSSDAVLPATSQNSQIYAAPVGAVVSWLTSTVSGRRRLRGRTFIVPCVAGAFELNGTLSDAAKGAFTTAATDLLFEQSLSLVVWGRPVVAAPATPTSLAVVARAGTHGLVTGIRVPDLAAVLRSRRS